MLETLFLIIRTMHWLIHKTKYATQLNIAVSTSKSIFHFGIPLCFVYSKSWLLLYTCLLMLIYRQEKDEVKYSNFVCSILHLPIDYCENVFCIVHTFVTVLLFSVVVYCCCCCSLLVFGCHGYLKNIATFVPLVDFLTGVGKLLHCFSLRENHGFWFCLAHK